MVRKKIICIFISMLIVASGIQILIDHYTVLKVEQSAISAVRRPEYCIFIEIEDKTLYLLEDGECIKEYPIASGKSGYPSPIGYWKVTTKDTWGEGFGGRWMGLNVPWGIYGIHGTTTPGSIGSAASKGCIRMFSEDVEELYSMVPHGTPVVIVNGQFGPFGRGFDSIEPGDRGADVMAIQRRLKNLGYFKGWLSGIYDDDLKNAVHRFQKDKGLPLSNTINKRCWEAMGFLEFE